MDLDARVGQVVVEGRNAPTFALGVAGSIGRYAHLRLGAGYTRTDLGWERNVYALGDATVIGNVPLITRAAELGLRLEWRTGPGVRAKPSWDVGPIIGLSLSYGEEQRVVILEEDAPDYLLVEATPFSLRVALRPAIGGYAEIWMGQHVAVVLEGAFTAAVPLLAAEMTPRWEHSSTIGLRVRLGPSLGDAAPEDRRRRHYAPEYLPPWRR